MAVDHSALEVDGLALDEDQSVELTGWKDAASGAAAADFPLAIANIRLDPHSPLPIHEQICQSIRAAVAAQELPAATLLPSSRELAQYLGVARNTVAFAYVRLVAEGVCVSNTRRGTRIATDFPVRSGVAGVVSEERSRLRSSMRTAFHVRSALEVGIDRGPNGAPFVLNASDPVLYPRTKLGRRIAQKFLDVPLRSQATHMSEPSRFQTSLAAYLRSARGVVCEPSQVIAVTGLEGALDLTTRVLLDPGDTVQVQDPAMDIAHSVFFAARANIVPIPTDAHGADPESVVGPPARLICVSPSVSFPHGTQMSEQRRRAVLRAARAQNAIILENEGYCEMRYGGLRLSSIQGMDEDGQVVYCGSFAEALGHSVDIGYLVVPPTLVESFVEMGRRISNAPPRQLQDAVAEFVDEHEYAFHARNVRSVYADRLKTVMRACREYLPRCSVVDPNGGLFVVLRPEHPLDDVAVCNEAAAEGIPVRPLSRYFISRAVERGVVLGFGAIAERAIRAAVQQLAVVLARHEARSGNAA
ncbi:MAG TPA: PLP-dependent aminotransferase family protein [Rhizomicrobium sp.]|nr:PLP-dependent aminotransferase family protein [Rhizomicrobium sp.]